MDHAWLLGGGFRRYLDGRPGPRYPARRGIADSGQVYQKQLAATIAALLGDPVAPGHPPGHPIDLPATVVACHAGRAAGQSGAAADSTGTATANRLGLQPINWAFGRIFYFCEILRMAFNSFLQLFTPKDRVFYSLFEEVADSVARMGKLMKEVVAEPDFDKRAAIIPGGGPGACQ